MNSLITKRYGNVDHLQPPEKSILESIRKELINMSMLDIGIGGGRTSLHFMPLVKHYVGIDYSSEMIDVCKKRFPEHKEKFMICDVRNLSSFDSNFFDFVMFSFNGLDYISHADRLLALTEIKRVLKKNGLFVFSSHNLQSDALFKIKLTINPIKLAENILKYFYVKANNKTHNELMKNDYSLIKDAGHFFTLTNYYIKPLSQVSQLEELGFSNIRMYSLPSGSETLSEFQKVNDPWIYYSCTK